MAWMAKERIGILGGTFNPIHSGHLAIAKAALEQAELDRVIFLPDGSPPHKTGIADAEDRYRMVCMAVCQNRRFDVSRMELDRDGTTYTVDTLATIRTRMPKAHLYYIIGTDTLMKLRSWHCYEQVLPMCTFLVAPRDISCTREEISQEKKRLRKLGGTFIFLDMPFRNVASTQIRSSMADPGTDEEDLPAVSEYCAIRPLYGMPMRISQGKRWLDRLYLDLNIRRFTHTMGVAFTARQLALEHHVDPLRAETAALLHDCAKCMPLEQMQRLCREHSLTNDAMIMTSGNLLHAVAGAYLAAVDYGIQDPDILRAISCHTTGKIGMTRLDMVVYLADKIEPGREEYPGLARIRMTAHLSLEKAMLMCLEETASYVKSGMNRLHPQTLQTIEWLKSLPELNHPGPEL